MKFDYVSENGIALRIPHALGAPHINGPTNYGATPGKLFFFAIPARGERPILFGHEGRLPSGLHLNPDSGLISGIAKEEGVFELLLTAGNRHGKTVGRLRLEIAPGRLARTPLLGWTSWSAHTTAVNANHIRTAADLLVTTGLASRGFAQINIDSCWQGARDAETLRLQPNSNFPGMAELVRHIHERGLKAGIYSTPMVHAWGSDECRLLPGSTGYPLDPDHLHGPFGGCGLKRYEENDAAQWAEWEFDYLKYDWSACDVEHAAAIRKALDATPRDFLLSLTTSCRPEWIDGYRKCANMCRANADTADVWNKLVNNFLGADPWLKLTGPGCWYDLDMLALGAMAIDRKPGESRTNRLTRNEQLAHLSMWALLPSPLQISCELAELDEFTLDLLCNEEILAVNQDSLGTPAVCIAEEKRYAFDGRPSLHTRVYRRRLADDGIALGFFNLGEEAASLSCPSEPGRTIRDLWACRDLGESDGELLLRLPAHGARILRLTPEKR